MQTELQGTGTVQQVRPLQRNLDEFAPNESVVALEEQAGASHIGDFPGAVLPGFQRVCQLQGEWKTALLPAVTASDRRYAAREVSPVQGKQIRAVRIIKTRPLERGRGSQMIVSAYQRF